MVNEVLPRSVAPRFALHVRQGFAQGHHGVLWKAGVPLVVGAGDAKGCYCGGAPLHKLKDLLKGGDYIRSELFNVIVVVTNPSEGHSPFFPFFLLFWC